MKALTLLIIIVFGMLASCLFAQQDISKGDYLEVTCVIVDSTDTVKNSYAINEPVKYILEIRNISEFPISYRYSSENNSLFSISVKSYYSVKNESGTFSSNTLDSDGVLEVGDKLRDTFTVIKTQPGKYEFLIEPNFNFPKEYWPSTGPLYRVFDVVGTAEGE